MLLYETSSPLPNRKKTLFKRIAEVQKRESSVPTNEKSEEDNEEDDGVDAEDEEDGDGDLIGSEISSFRDLDGIPEWLLGRCDALGFMSPTKVQQRSLPSILDGKDVILQAQTGSGKTLAYGLPILSKVDPSRAAIQAVVVVPTRELGLQVSNVLRKLAAGSPEKITIMPLVEGSQNRRQQLWAIADPPHIVVGNPRSLQRIVDLGKLRLNAVSFVVLDEVDACLINHDTRQELHQLLSRRLSNTYQAKDEDNIQTKIGAEMTENLVYSNLAAKQADVAAAMIQYRISRQTIMCSATIPQRQHFASACRQNGWTETIPTLIHVSSKELVPKQVSHEYVECPKPQRLACLKYLIKKESQDWLNNNANSNEGGGNRGFQLMIFLDDNSQLSTEAVVSAAKNAIAGYRQAMGTLGEGINNSSENKDNDGVALILDDMHIDERSAALNSFREGSCNVLVTSDMLARGIDIPDITHVIQLHLPNRVETYLHRSGRVGRNGRQGKVVTMISDDEAFVVSRYSNELGIPIKLRPLKIAKKNE